MRGKLMKAVVGDTVVAEAASEAVISIEGNVYFPPASLAAGALRERNPVYLPVEGAGAVPRRRGR